MSWTCMHVSVSGETDAGALKTDADMLAPRRIAIGIKKDCKSTFMCSNTNIECGFTGKVNPWRSRSF